MILVPEAVRFWRHLSGPLLISREGRVPAYKLNVVAKRGTAVHIATTETATEALSVLRGTAHFHSRVWITDQDGNDVSEDQLIERAAAERHQS